MEYVALIVSLLAAVFTGMQWKEARETRLVAARANELAEKVEARQQREDERAAVQWRPRMHPDYQAWVQFENIGTSTAHEVRFDPSDFTSVRVDNFHGSWRVGPREFTYLTVVEPWDLRDMPETLKIRHKRDPNDQEWVETPVSLSDLREEFRRISAEEYRRRVTEPAERAVRREAELRTFEELRTEITEVQQPVQPDPSPEGAADVDLEQPGGQTPSSE